MRSVIVMSALLMAIPSLAFGKDEKCRPCVKTPQQKCKEARGKWVGDMCVKTRIIRRVKTRPAPLEGFELQCYRRGGEWRDGLCYARNAPVPVVMPSANSSAVANSRLSVVVRNATTPAATKTANGNGKVKKSDYQWWWIGPGVFVLGTWAGEKDFIVGASGKLVFAVNKRFRVAGLVGAGLGPWQESKPNILVGAEASIRLWNWFFLNAGLETVWGGFQGLSVHRRIFFAGIGPDFWIGERANISLHFLFGTRDDVTSCSTDLGKLTIGNLLQINIYF